ncbi:MAG: carboxypeptidase-like regulatory domain-containing protein, partial [Nitrospiria bacterium]
MSFQLSAFSLTLLLLGCEASEFPGRQTPFSGVTDVPFVTTFNFNFRTGLSNLSAADGVLSIISAGDLLNLISAANITQIDRYGIVGGVVTDPSGAPVEGVTLILTDSSGNVVGDVFYNGLGGTPDFVQTSGTTANGSFTIFNVPPGEVYLKA